MEFTLAVPAVGRRMIASLSVLAFSLVGAAMARAQSAPSWRDVTSTRSDLQARVDAVQAQADASPSADERRSLSLEADVLKRRLKEGDFVVGDRVVVKIEEQVTLADTFTVRSGKVLELPGFGTVDLTGALWSEAAERVRQQVLKYVKEPRVSLTPLVRIGIMGAVARPGYYQLPTDMPLADAMMRAGGPALNGDPSRAAIRRADQELFSASALRDAIAQGLTIEQMALHSGDELDVPEQHHLSSQMLLQALGVLAAVSAVVVTQVRR